MARNEVVTIPAETWTQLTNSAVTAITFQVKNDQDVLIAVTPGTEAPENLDMTLIYPPRTGEVSVPLADLFPGVSEGSRVFAYAFGDARVFVSHA